MERKKGGMAPPSTGPAPEDRVWASGSARWRLVGGAIILGLTGPVPAAAFHQQSATAARALVFEGVTVVDVEQGKLVPDQRVVIVGTRILAMGSRPKVPPPKGALVVDSRGRYLIPGLWDMHVHVQEYPQVFYPLLIANGVTGVRDMGTRWLDSSLKWRREIITGMRVGPRVVLTGSYLEMESPDNGTRLIDAGSLEIQVPTPARAREVVDSLKRAGADFIKVHDGLSREVYFAVAAEARRLGIPVVGHFPRKVATPAEVSDSGQRSIEHGLSIGDCSPGGSDEGCAALAAQFIRNGTWRTPTFVVYRYFFGGVAPERMRFWPDTIERVPRLGRMSPVVNDGVIKVMTRMKRAGMPLLAGTDASSIFPENTPGFSLHEELAILVEVGLTPAEALRTATLNPAKFFGAPESLGTVAPGKLADLVLLDADPLADIHHTMKIRAVVANGRYFDRATLDKLVAEVEARAKDK